MRHCVFMVVEGKKVPEGWGREVQIQSTLFYAENNFIASIHVKLLQGAFDAFMGMCDCLGI